MVAPSISSISPPTATAIASEQTLSLQVLDNGTALLRVLIALQFPGMELWEIVYDGTAFTERYSRLSVVTNVTGGKQYDFQRQPVWPDSPRLKVWAVNTAAEETTSLAAYWVLSEPVAPPSSSLVPVFPAAPGPGPGSSNARALDQAHFLGMFDRFLAPEWIRPIRDRGDGSGYEMLRAYAAVGARVSTAIQSLESGSIALFAQGPAYATGTVEFLRVAATAGAVRIKAGTLVQTSRNGRMFRTTETVEFGALALGPIACPVVAVDVGEEYNVPGTVVTPSGITLPGEIDTVFRMFQQDTSGVDDWLDGTITVRQILACTGGRSPWLDALGQDRGITRNEGEPDDVYRFRVRGLPDNLTPAAIQRALNALADKWGVTYEFIETFESSYQTAYDYPSKNAGTPTYDGVLPVALADDTNVFVYDDPRDPADGFINRWLDEVEYRGAFIVVVSAPASLREFGAPYDSADMLVADRETLNGSVAGVFAIAAYDLPNDLSPDAGQPGCYDGFDAGTSGFWGAWWQTMQELKAAGIVAVLELKGE